MKVYTGTGDRGKTSLFSGERVSKTSLRVEAYGNIDELNAVIGAVISALGPGQETLKEELCVIQSRLMDIGAWLATTPETDSIQFLSPFTKEPAIALESAIDRMSEELPILKQFVLPGGHLAASFAHMARTICRRAERRSIQFAESEETVNETSETMAHILVFLNRLSDYLFVLARYANKLNGQEDILWNP